jgi:L-2,4-diaminobutyrate decarboxylase
MSGSDALTPLQRVLAEIEADSQLSAGEAFVALAARYMAAAGGGEGNVSGGGTMEAIASRFDEAMPREGRSLESLLERVQHDVIDNANRLMHPMYMGHQVSPPIPVAIWTDVLISALNQSVAVAEMSPSITPIEHRVVRWLCDAAGLGAESGGTLTSGGTEATFTALLAARAALMPSAWEEGVGGDLPVILCGEHTHYSVKRAAAQLGLGVQRALPVRSRGYRMDTDALAQEIREKADSGTRIMAVVATSGSTATGAFDDLEEIARLCAERNIWLHVDGAHGASALLSSAHRHRLRGIERASSISWDAHKMMLMPLPAGVLLVRDERLLDRAFVQSAPYLFHGSEGERIADQGVRSFMCSRRSDALKLWLAVHRHGSEGFAAVYDALAETTRALWEEIGVREDFEAAHEPESNILCFRWIGDGSMQSGELDAANRALRERYNESGHGWITTTLLDGRRWLRVTIMNPRTSREHVRALLQGLAREAQRG